MNNGKVSLVIVLGILVMVLSSGISSAVQKEAHTQAISGNTNISNSYINIVVDPRGGYTMGTTGGNPATGTDDNQKLLFGYPTSFSSYMTVRIDDTNYYFDSYSNVGNLNGYIVSGPTVSGNSIITNWRIGDIGVTQTISITTSSTTGREDTALFKISLTNNGNVAHSAGARFLFDTMLGSNDNAPFRLAGMGDVTTEREFNGSDVPAYWQAFDSLTNPSVISQGTLSTSTPPGRFIMANWGNLHSVPWDYSVHTGSANGDSATAVYWNPVNIQPGGSLEYTTAYGLGGVTITTQGALSLGITSPINATVGDNFTITAYLQNTGNVAINNIIGSASLPSGITLASGETSQKTVGTLAAGESTQVSWNVRAAASGNYTYYLILTSSNAPSVTGNRSIIIAAVPEVTVTATPEVTSNEADMVILVGDIDNLGFGWPAGFDVFSGASTPVHSYPYLPDANDANGTDRIMVGTSYNGNPPRGQDGYTSYTSRPDNLPEAIDMQYNLDSIPVRSATLQMFVDDFQSPVWGSTFQVTLNGQRALFLENVLNALDQTGPIGKLITVQIPADFLPFVESGHLSIYIDDPTTGAGDGYAIDFIRLLVNPHISTVGNVSGKVIDATTGLVLQGVTVSASGTVTGVTGSDGTYTLSNVPAGLVVVTASKNGYTSQTLSADLVAGTSITLDFALSPAPAPTATPTPAPTPLPSGMIRQWASSASERPASY